MASTGEPEDEMFRGWSEEEIAEFKRWYWGLPKWKKTVWWAVSILLNLLLVGALIIAGPLIAWV